MIKNAKDFNTYNMQQFEDIYFDFYQELEAEGISLKFMKKYYEYVFKSMSRFNAYRMADIIYEGSYETFAEFENDKCTGFVTGYIDDEKRTGNIVHIFSESNLPPAKQKRILLDLIKKMTDEYIRRGITRVDAFTSYYNDTAAEVLESLQFKEIGYDEKENNVKFSK